jgi:hypothetical protein
MDRDEAKKLLTEELNFLAARRYDELVALIKHDDVKTLKGPSGTTYQIEISVFWDAEPNGNLRIAVSIDDGGWRAFVPLTDSLIIKPDGILL